MSKTANRRQAHSRVGERWDGSLPASSTTSRQVFDEGTAFRSIDSRSSDRLDPDSVALKCQSEPCRSGVNGLYVRP